MYSKVVGNKSCTRERKLFQSSIPQEFVYAHLSIVNLREARKQKETNLLKKHGSINVVFEATAVRSGCLVLLYHAVQVRTFREALAAATAAVVAS